MPSFPVESWTDVARDCSLDETSDERFDRAAFARDAIALVDPPRTTIAICEGTCRMRVESGRLWGRGPGERWAMLVVPPHASRRAIALAVAGLAREARPWVLEVLLSSRALQTAPPEREAS